MLRSPGRTVPCMVNGPLVTQAWTLLGMGEGSEGLCEGHLWALMLATKPEGPPGGWHACGLQGALEVLREDLASDTPSGTSP